MMDLRIDKEVTMRRALLVAVALALFSAAVLPAAADEEDPSPPDPRNRVEAWTPKPAGERSTIVLQYGPYVVHPGSDLSRVDVEIAALDGFVMAAQPAVRYADGTEPSDDVVHIHHAHWVKVRNPQDWPSNGSTDYNQYISWFFGTGEEKTRGSADLAAQTDPRYADGLRYGIELNRGDKLAFVSMLHNKTSQTLTLWLEGRFEFVHGTRDEIRAATGEDFRPLTPVLHGATFQAPRTGGMYTWPLDLPAGKDAPGRGIRSGVGHVWTAPQSGTIIIGAGHLHPGGRQVVVSNLGRLDSPCADVEQDGLPGRTIVRIDAYYASDDQGELFPSEGYQMGITQRAWRAKVRAGDRIAINGTYDTTDYAYPDAMSFFGFYMDTEEPPLPGEECGARLLDNPGATHGEIVGSIRNREDSLHGTPCRQCDDPNAPLPSKGIVTDQIHIAGFRYVPGDLRDIDPSAPVVPLGSTLRIVNEDWALGLVRHSITTCAAPCDGPYAMNYPFHDGVLDSGPLGYTLVDTYETTKAEPYWEVDTAELGAGYYAYYCRLHTWMRGSFYVE